MAKVLSGDFLNSLLFRHHAAWYLPDDLGFLFKTGAGGQELVKPVGFVIGEYFEDFFEPAVGI